jgi:AcrR family transcriptional regulator
MASIAPSVPVSRRERNSAERRERLFRSALELFARKGFAETTVEDITNAADLGKGTFFNYFPSKEHILLAFGEMQLGKLQIAFEEMRSRNVPVPVFMRSLGARMTQEPIRNPAIIRILLQAFLTDDSKVRQPMLELQNRVIAIHTEMIRIGQERGEIRNDLPPEVIANVFRQTVFGTLLIWALHGDSTLLSRMENAFELLWTGLAPRHAAPARSSQLPPVATVDSNSAAAWLQWGLAL